jgi:AAA domain, putative AbiEii toxin, Type IV TA system/AAA ATPase domain
LRDRRTLSKPSSFRSLKLVNYKGFENHTISLRRTNVLVGANNAGKTTALGALRLIVAMLPQARRIAPSEVGEADGRPTRGWPITAAAVEASAFSNENIRYDFRPKETRIEVTVNTGVRLVASWANMEDYDIDEASPSGMYYVFPPNDGATMPPRTVARELVPNVAVVPTLTPLDDRESYVADETLRRHMTGRKASRYFRNALWRLDEEEWRDFTSYVYERTPELATLFLRRAQGTLQDDFDLFYTEERTRHEREIGWAGDGIQIWLQALFHLWRQRGSDVVILDEPDVFLHPDLQRRLARTLFGTAQQTIVATHSVEILAEAEPGSAVWIDRSRRTSERPRADGSLALMGRRLGSGYELGVGRALRSSSVLFVEGDDAPVLAHLARRLGKSTVASSDSYATVPLGGFSRNWLASAFTETMVALGGSVETFVILDGDLRCQEAIDFETRELRKVGAQVHVWSRRELENYMLVASAIAKVAGIPRGDAVELLIEVVSEQKDEALLTLETQRLDEHKRKIGAAAKLAQKTVLENAKNEFNTRWATLEGQLGLVDAKVTIRMLNTRLQARKAKTVNVHSLARNIPPGDIPSEVQDVIRKLETFIKGN